MNAVDTNVLIYARDPRDSVKHQRTRQLTAGMTDGRLLWQVACEFIAASRKLTSVGYTQAQAWRELEQLRRLWKLIVPSENVFPRAEQLTSEHKVSF
jgi:predicted nucleic acid-binding protein